MCEIIALYKFINFRLCQSIRIYLIKIPNFILIRFETTDHRTRRSFNCNAQCDRQTDGQTDER